jgi:hypothetical protein
MEILVKRLWRKATYTIGRLYVDGKYVCNTLEDKDRGLTQSMPLERIKAIKVPGETAIPTGTYKVTIQWSPHFKRMLPHIESVPGFDYILIHAGNTNKDTRGCILVGENKKVGQLVNSRKWAYDVLTPLIEKVGRGSCTIRIE